MNLKEALLFAYGVIFATSTPYLKPKKRFLFPTALSRVDDRFSIFLGGSGLCASLRSNDQTFIVNTNLGGASDEWCAFLQPPAAHRSIALSSLNGAFGNSESLSKFGPSDAVFVFAENETDLKEFAHADVTNVREKTVLEMCGERVHLIPAPGCATESDLVVYFESRSTMMFGALFSNRLHPLLKIGVAARASQWIATLDDLLKTYQPRACVPAEGPVGSEADVREFIRYLSKLTDPGVEFSECRRDFDWMEIPSATSLEENFDLLRRNVKTHTSIR